MMRSPLAAIARELLVPQVANAMVQKVRRDSSIDHLLRRSARESLGDADATS
jgi:hypothetical protein